MTVTWIQRSFAPAKRLTPGFIWRPLRSAVTAFATPVRFSFTSGHFRSSFLNRAVDRSGVALPWYTYPAIDFLSYRDFGGRHVLEFGAGQSTLWWSKRAAGVVAIEEDAVWATELSAKINQNVVLIHSPLLDGIEPIASRLRGRQFDVVVIDGHLRCDLVDLAFELLRPDGALIVDDADGYGYQAALQRHECQRI